MAAPSSHMWYVKAAGGVWGPYPEARLGDFVAEGRVGSTTLVSPWAAGPYQPAAGHAEFRPLFEARPTATDPTPSSPASSTLAPPDPVLTAPLPVAPELQAPAPLPSVSPALVSPAPLPLADAGPMRPMLVWAQLSAASAPNFLAILGAAGPGVTVRPGLWLVQARTSAATLRNLLSRRLGEADALLVVEAPLEQVAWFNLDPAHDRELRRMWTTPVSP